MKHLNKFQESTHDETPQEGLYDDISSIITDLKDDTDLLIYHNDGVFLLSENKYSERPDPENFKEAIKIQIIRKSEKRIGEVSVSEHEYLKITDEYEKDTDKIRQFIKRIKSLNVEIEIYEYKYMDEEYLIVVMPMIFK